MSAHRLTKASARRALERQGACWRAIRWFDHQPSLRVAFSRVMRRPGNSVCSLDLSGRGCWLLAELGLHRDEPLPTYDKFRARALQRGWWR